MSSHHRAPQFRFSVVGCARSREGTADKRNWGGETRPLFHTVVGEERAEEESEDVPPRGEASEDDEAGEGGEGEERVVPSGGAQSTRPAGRSSSRYSPPPSVSALPVSYRIHSSMFLAQRTYEKKKISLRLYIERDRWVGGWIGSQVLAPPVGICPSRFVPDPLVDVLGPENL